MAFAPALSSRREEEVVGAKPLFWWFRTGNPLFVCSLYNRRHWTVTVKFIPWCMVQYSLKVPAVVKGPADLLSPPEKLMLTVGAPASLLGLGVVPSQVPLTMTCGAVAVSTSVIDSPFLTVIVLSMKSEGPILTCGPVEIVLASRMVQAANKMVSRAKLVMNNKNFLYMKLPFKPPWFFLPPMSY